MCGRFVQAASQATWEAFFAELGVGLAWAPPDRFNLAPSQPMLAVAHTDAGTAQAKLQFGMRMAGGKLIINARGETVAEKPLFRGPLHRGRVLVAATAFYEWAPRPQQRRKQPYCFAREDGAPFWFAALARAGHQGDEAAIVTTEANEVVGPYHSRMPVMLSLAAAKRWLDPITPADAAQALLIPYASAMRHWAVSHAVNGPGHDAPDCMAPVP